MGSEGMSLIWIKGIFAGLLFGLLNFWFLTRIVNGMLRKEKVPAWKTGVFFLGKLLLIGATIGLLLWKGYVSPLPFLVGFTVSLVGGIAKKMRDTKTQKA